MVTYVLYIASYARLLVRRSDSSANCFPLQLLHIHHGSPM